MSSLAVVEFLNFHRAISTKRSGQIVSRGFFKAKVMSLACKCVEKLWRKNKSRREFLTNLSLERKARAFDEKTQAARRPRTRLLRRKIDRLKPFHAWSENLVNLFSQFFISRAHKRLKGMRNARLSHLATPRLTI